MGRKPGKKYGDLFDSNNLHVKKIPYFEFFIERYSKSTQDQIYNKLVEFADFCKKNINKGILEVNSLDILKYFKDKVEKKKNYYGKPLKKDTKVKYRNLLNAYYNYVKIFKKDIEQDDTYKNPVPSSKTWDFKGTTSSIDNFQIIDTSLNFEAIRRIFEYLWYVVESKRIYYAVSLICYGGPRVSEVCHIKIKNLDVKNRWYITRIKSRATDKKDGIYFFPEFFVPELKNYINKILKKNYTNPKYLFQEGDIYLHPKTIRKHLKDAKHRLGLECNTNPHTFRDFINTLRIEMRIPRDIRKLLLNQKSKDVNITHYAKKFKNRIHLRNLYDKCTPFFKESFRPKEKI